MRKGRKKRTTQAGTKERKPPSAQGRHPPTGCWKRNKTAKLFESPEEKTPNTLDLTSRQQPFSGAGRTQRATAARMDFRGVLDGRHTAASRPEGPETLGGTQENGATAAPL